MKRRTASNFHFSHFTFVVRFIYVIVLVAGSVWKCAVYSVLCAVSIVWFAKWRWQDKRCLWIKLKCKKTLMMKMLKIIEQSKQGEEEHSWEWLTIVLVYSSIVDSYVWHWLIFSLCCCSTTLCLSVCMSLSFYSNCALNLLSVPIVHCRMEYPQWKTATIYLNDFGTTQYLQLSFWTNNQDSSSSAGGHHQHTLYVRM